MDTGGGKCPTARLLDRCGEKQLNQWSINTVLCSGTVVPIARGSI